ncbi:hypothetical protein VTK56DRAFT_7342 [Thermocarpiscus australiensis]
MRHTLYQSLFTQFCPVCNVPVVESQVTYRYLLRLLQASILESRRLRGIRHDTAGGLGRLAAAPQAILELSTCAQPSGRYGRLLVPSISTRPVCNAMLALISQWRPTPPQAPKSPW